MTTLVPETGFAVVCPDGVTPDAVEAYHERLRAAERDLAPGGARPLSDRLDTAAAVEQSVPGEVLDVTARIEPELLALLDPEAVVAILEPPGPGFHRVADADRLLALADVVEHRRDEYLAARGDAATRADSRCEGTPGESRVVAPEVQFETDYVVPLRFAAERPDCAVQWEFFRDDDLRDVRWPDAR